MSALLTWKFSPVDNSAKTAGSDIGLIQDIKAMVFANDADASYRWAVASFNFTTFPYYLVLKPKSGAVGRILFVVYSGAPSVYNVVLWDGHTGWDGSFMPNRMLYTYFPKGNVDTPSNLQALGTVMGDDAEACQLGGGGDYYIPYQFQYDGGSTRGLYYAENEEMFLLRRSGYNSMLMFGNCWVDASDNAYGGFVDGAISGSDGGNCMLCANRFHSNAEWIGNAQGYIAPLGGGIEYPNGRFPFISLYFEAKRNTRWQFQPDHSYIVPTSRHIDTANGKVWFRSKQIIHLYDQTTGAGFINVRPTKFSMLKFRQMACSVQDRPNAFYEFYETGPTLIAKQFDNAASNATGPWLTYFKV